MPSALATPAFGTAACKHKVEVAANANNGTGSQPSSTRGQIAQATYFLLDRGIRGLGRRAKLAARPDGQAGLQSAAIRVYCQARGRAPYNDEASPIALLTLNYFGAGPAGGCLFGVGLSVWGLAGVRTGVWMSSLRRTWTLDSVPVLSGRRSAPVNAGRRTMRGIKTTKTSFC